MCPARGLFSWIPVHWLRTMRMSSVFPSTDSGGVRPARPYAAGRAPAAAARGSGVRVSVQWTDGLETFYLLAMQYATARVLNCFNGLSSSLRGMHAHPTLQGFRRGSEWTTLRTWLEAKTVWCGDFLSGWNSPFFVRRMTRYRTRLDCCFYSSHPYQSASADWN